jgi:putative DNA primase/helicase
VRLFGDRIRYVHTWGAWLVWDGTRWLKDETGEINRLARETVRAMYAEAAETDDSGTRKALARWASTSESAGKLGAMVDLAQSEPGIAVHHTALDTKPWLLNCRNGTIDLRTGKLLEHNRDDLITKRVDVDYRPDAPAPLWAQFMGRITEGNNELATYMQRAAGYTLTGDVGEQCLFFCYGTGSNGKSTFVETLADLLRNYWLKAPTEMLMVQRNGGNIPNDVARLPGARMVVAAEVTEGRRLDEAKIKDLTGGDTLVARFMKQEFFEFRPVFKLWMYGNHKPVIRGTDNGIWRRIRLVPFTATIPDSEKDPAFRSKLQRELPGILAWAVQGCLAWQREGLTPPEVVRQATDDYRAEQDTIGAFLDECCVIGPDMKAQATALYKAYVAWSEANNEHPIPQKQFGQRLDLRGFESKRANNGFWRYGVGLLASRAAPDDPPGDPSGDPVNRGEPNSDITEPSKNPMGHVQKRFTTVHGSRPATIPYRESVSDRLQRQREEREAADLARIQAEAEDLN